MKNFGVMPGMRILITHILITRILITHILVTRILKMRILVLCPGYIGYFNK